MTTKKEKKKNPANLKKAEFLDPSNRRLIASGNAAIRKLRRALTKLGRRGAFKQLLTLEGDVREIGSALADVLQFETYVTGRLEAVEQRLKTVPPVKRKRLNAAGRKKLSDSMRRRWAARKASVND
jgi:hypothetical protein